VTGSTLGGIRLWSISKGDTELPWVFYIRKSLSVGPFRFNLSKSGIGLSAGIKGLRVGTGPRGNYVHMGRGGLYFRQTIPNSDSRRIPSEVPEEQSSGFDFKEIESGSVSHMVDSSSAALLEEISSKSKKAPIWPWVLGFNICLLGALAIASASIWVFCVLVPLCAGGLVWAIHADKLRKTVVLFYELEPHIEQAFQDLHNAFALSRGCSSDVAHRIAGRHYDHLRLEDERRGKLCCAAETNRSAYWFTAIFPVQHFDSCSSGWAAAAVLST